MTLKLQASAEQLPLADGSVDLVFGSPPYCDARTYGIDAQRGCQEWIDWMLVVTGECLRVSRGPVIWVAKSVTRDRTYWPAVEGLMYEWWRSGGSAYRPCYYHRYSSIGSGGDDWFRDDTEYVACFKRPGKLPWSDNTAMGHAPKWAPGGAMSHRMANGSRVNQWGRHQHATDRQVDGRKTKSQKRPSHLEVVVGDSGYAPPVLANPGNLIHCKVGHGNQGDLLCHEEKLAEWFVLSLCPPGGTVLDPFSGSGTTAKVAKAHGREAIAIDLRLSQCKLTQRRVAAVQKELFV